MESPLTTSPPRRSARSTARSDFPAAVGPTTATTGGWSGPDTAPVSQARAPVAVLGCRGRNDPMSIFDKLRKSATKAVDQHGDKISRGLDKAAKSVDERTGHKHSHKIRQGVSKAKEGMKRL